MSRISPIDIVLVMSALFALTTSQASLAQEDANATMIQVEAQPLPIALQEFSEQTGLQVAYVATLAENVNSKGARNAATPVDALAQILDSTGLEYQFVNDETVAIGPAAAADEGGDSDSGNRRAARGMPMPVMTAQASQREENIRASVDDRPGATTVDAEDARRERQRGIPEILVKGSRTFNADIQRTEDDVQPYVVFDRDEIEQSMASDLEGFFRTRLPMNTVTEVDAQNATSGSMYGTQSRIDLRGLGPNQTLVLVNGRRMPSVSTVGRGNGDFRQPDINGIPLSAVERIEVLPATASGIYGGGATGGVVNIVLKRDYSGIELNATYENTFDTDVAKRTLAINTSFSPDDGRTNVVISGSYSDSNSLLVGDRDFAQQGRALLFANDPDAFLNSFSPPTGYTTNIQSASSVDGSSNLMLDNGTLLDSNITFVPVGYGGPVSDDGAALAANAGQYNLDLPHTLNGAGGSLYRNPIVQSITANVRREFTDQWEAFVDLSSFSNESKAQSARVPLSRTIAGDAPSNPFQNDVRVTYPVPNLAFDTLTDSDVLRAAGGVILRLPHKWMAAAEYAWSRSRYEQSRTDSIFNSDFYDGLNDGRLDIFQDVNAFPLDYEAFLTGDYPDYLFGPADTILRDASFRLAGPMLELPAGSVTWSVLLDRRKEKALGTYQQTSIDTRYNYARSQEVDSAYLEVLVPIVSSANSVALVHEMDLQLSVRRDEYVNNSAPTGTVFLGSLEDPIPEPGGNSHKLASTDYTIGIRYTPSEDLALRASYGTGFLPPSLSQVFATDPRLGSHAFYDPKRGGTVQIVRDIPTLHGGNPDLLPEESESLSAGVIFTPRSLAGLRVSVDYTRIEKAEEIASINSQMIVDNEDYFSDRLTRAPLTEEDMELGYAGGVVTSLDLRFGNITRTMVEALDIQANYAFDVGLLGHFNFYAVVTRAMTFERQATPTSDVVDPVGYSGGPLKWRANGGVTWDRGGWTLGWNTQYYDSRLVYGATASEGSIENAVRRQGSDSIPSQIYHDLSARYRFGDAPRFGSGLLSNMELLLAIQNVFNTEPPIIATSGTRGYSAIGDPRLRRYAISIRKSF